MMAGRGDEVDAALVRRHIEHGVCE